MTIREATAVDVPALLALGERFHAEVYAGVIPWRADLWEQQGRGLIENPSGVILVSEDERGIAGMLGLLSITHPMTGEATIAELFWFVDAAIRGTVGLRLLRAGQRWATQQQAVKMLMIAPNDTVSALYERLGYRLVERSYEVRL